MQLCWISAAERSLAALLEETLVEKPGFPGFFFWNIACAIGLPSQPGQDQFPPSRLGSASTHTPRARAPGRRGVFMSV
jgi:hypothetical protein